MEFHEKTISSKNIFQGKIINLRIDDVSLPDGRTAYREIVEHNGGVAIVAVKDKKIVLVKQFRKPLDNTLVEIPAGKLEKNEEPQHCALRELEEETGLIPLNLKPLCSIFTSPGFSNERLHLFFADEFKEGALNRDDDEFMDILYVTLDSALEMIQSGEITDAKSICGILLYSQFIER
ncbi:ADP-ribose pyrophosphatase [Oxobacter pfennigii]|uniref:ADP-ribose pyrophosphatase n=1 Tax=Oxobacter pfennigii TaxID=36849 RepID=A0A0P9AHD1_9CLOT|nr:NUDIX hydrolase [Oxobacter pfennigii]KPU44878.1 ADP-ribose pyrophosphatase [Oxobacter pfennigii]